MTFTRTLREEICVFIIILSLTNYYLFIQRRETNVLLSFTALYNQDLRYSNYLVPFGN